MRTTLGELQDGEAEGNLTEDETLKLSAFRELILKASQRFKAAAIGIEALIRSVDPYSRKDSLAALIVAGRRRGVPVYDTPGFQAELAKLISDDIDRGKTDFIQDIAGLTGQPEMKNRQSLCLSVLLDFYDLEERWPTKKELENHAVKMFPELFREMDDKQWRRTRKDLGLEWLKNDKRRTKRGA